MTQIAVLGFLLLASTIGLTSANAAVSAEDAVSLKLQATQENQAREEQLLHDSQVVRPSPREREAISQLLTSNPRPKTLNAADMKYLNELLDKPVWYGFERRILHEIWTEVNGKEWRDTEIAPPAKNGPLP